MEVKICENCGDKIKGRGLRFCSQSCNAKHHNKSKSKKVEKKCLSCGVITVNKKYCNPQCMQDYKRNVIFEKIENGDGSLYFKQYKKYLIHKYGEKCMECGWAEVNQYSGKIPIELEHIDGDSSNNSLDNLKLLCPNHHALTPTYKALNVGNGRHSRRERYQKGKSY